MATSLHSSPDGIYAVPNKQGQRVEVMKTSKLYVGQIDRFLAWLFTLLTGHLSGNAVYHSRPVRWFIVPLVLKRMIWLISLALGFATSMNSMVIWQPIQLYELFESPEVTNLIVILCTNYSPCGAFKNIYTDLPGGTCDALPLHKELHAFWGLTRVMKSFPAIWIFLEAWMNTEGFRILVDLKE